MVKLKKLRGSSLLENLIAGALLLVLFAATGTIINNLLGNTVKQDNTSFYNRVKETEYLLLHDKIALPYSIDNGLLQAAFEKRNTFLEVTITNDKKIETKKICCIAN